MVDKKKTCNIRLRLNSLFLAMSRYISIIAAENYIKGSIFTTMTSQFINLENFQFFEIILYRTYFEYEIKGFIYRTSLNESHHC